MSNSSALRPWFALPPCLTRGKFHPALIIEAPDGRAIVAVGQHKQPKKEYGQRIGKGGGRR